LRHDASLITALSSSHLLVNSLPTLIGLPFSTWVSGRHHRRQRLPLLPEKTPIIVSTFIRIRKRRICRVNLHEIIRRRVFPVNSRNIRMADSSKSPVRSLDFLIGSTCWYTENLVKWCRRSVRRTVHVKIRRSLLFCPCRTSFGGGCSACGDEYWLRSDTARRWCHGGSGEVTGGV